MYNFIDVNEALESAVLPAEALQINGQYIENLIEGYRTLHVQGREALSPELATYETGARDGSRLQNKRFPARPIVVTYQLNAKTNEAFRTAYNKLGGILNFEDATLIFADEKDKFYVGTTAELGEIEPGRNKVIGSFEILCLDPFKYSVMEYEVTPTDGVFEINYDGTYEAFPKLEAEFVKEDDDNLTGTGDCGFVAFFNEDGKILQFGDPTEVDGENYAKSQTLIFNEFDNFGASMTSKWPKNAAVTQDFLTQIGSVGVVSDVTSSATKMLTASDYGSGDYWHGPTITRQIPADASGEVGAKNFRFSYRQRMCSSKDVTNEYGIFRALLVNKTGNTRKIVAGVGIHKHSAGKNAWVYVFVNDECVREKQIDLNYTNKRTGYANKDSVLTTVIQKKGTTVNFDIAGIKYALDIPKDLAATEITFEFAKHGTNKALNTNGLYWAKFIKDNCETFSDVPNKFSTNDVLTIDCEEVSVLLNNVLTPELGALGNDWEEFCLTPGINRIATSCSEWVAAAKAPTFKLKYRKVYL